MSWVQKMKNQILHLAHKSLIMKKTSIIKKCEICGNEFTAHQYLLKKGQARFCSLECKSKDQSGKTNLLANRICLICSKPFHIQENQAKKGRGNFCSSVCYHKSTKGKIAHNKGIPMLEEQKLKVSKSRRGKMMGELNPAWKGGITPENRKIRASINYRLWREAVFAKDNWTCQECGWRGCKLHADHIKPFAIFPELRFAIDNGQTLCVGCHRKKTKKDLPIIRSMRLII